MLHQQGAPLQQTGLNRLAFFLDRAHAGNRNTKVPSLWKNNACICVEKRALWKA
jgi:hypothetical protein